MPDARVNIQALAAIAPQRNDAFQLKIVPGLCHRNHERLMIHRVKHLPTIRVIVQMPQQHPLQVIDLGGGIGSVGIFRPTQNILAADRIVVPVQHFALPLAMKDTLDRTTLIAGTRIDRPPVLRRPLHDFDFEIFRIRYQATIVANAFVGCDD